MNPSAVTFVFAELALAANAFVWLFYSHRPVMSAFAVALMAMTWQLHKWSRP